MVAVAVGQAGSPCGRPPGMPATGGTRPRRGRRSRTPWPGIKLDGSTAARFEVDDQQPVTGAEEVARMRFAVQQLLGSTAGVDPFRSALQRAEEKMPVGLSECGSFVFVRDEPFSLCHPVHEMWGCDLDVSHAGVQASE